MNANDLLQCPVWRAEDLGQALPGDPHSISMALPRWQDVVGYEEHRPEVMDRLRCGYPRFVIHPFVKQLAQRLGNQNPCLPFPSRRAAEECAAFVRRKTDAKTEVVTGWGVHGVITGESGVIALEAFWRHTGLIVSSRLAEACLQGKGAAADTLEVRQTLRQELAALYNCSAGDVFLQPTGMAAQFAALRAVGEHRPGLPTAQLGFPYVDTYKLQLKLGYGGRLLTDLERLEPDLRELLRQQALAACFCELPGNPLLGTADLGRVTPLLREHQIPLVADDVVATPVNIDLRPYADLIATSLTKYVAGTAEVMGGALICNPASPYYGDLKPIVEAQHEDLFYAEDARAVCSQVKSLPERMRRHNENGLLLAERLRRHDRVERVWYPKWECAEAYEVVRRAQGGWGSLITFLPKGAETRAPQIYDALALCKGPSLGTLFTLVCPYTLLAHYSELAWAESCGVSRYLIRLSVGLEDPEVLWGRIDRALSGMTEG